MSELTLLKITVKLIYLCVRTYPYVNHFLEQYSDSAKDCHKSELFWPYRAILWYGDPSTFLPLVRDYLTAEKRVEKLSQLLC